MNIIEGEYNIIIILILFYPFNSFLPSFLSAWVHSKWLLLYQTRNTKHILIKSFQIIMFVYPPIAILTLFNLGFGWYSPSFNLGIE